MCSFFLSSDGMRRGENEGAHFHKALFNLRRGRGKKQADDIHGEGSSARSCPARTYLLKKYLLLIEEPLQIKYEQIMFGLFQFAGQRRRRPFSFFACGISPSILAITPSQMDPELGHF